MSSKRAVKNARRKTRAAKRAAKRANSWPSGTDTVRELSEDEHLDALLTSRGWTVFDRAARGTMYDWPASTDGSDGEITYLLVDAPGTGSSPRYRVSCVDGDRRTYDDADSLIADLDHIEAIRGA
jgi:hypothetical protein